MDQAWVVAARRTPFTRAGKGAFAIARPDDLLAELIRALVAELPEPALGAIDDVVVGTAYPEAEQGRNVARLVALAAGLPERVPAMTLTRMCASSLEAAAIAAAKVRMGEAAIALVGGMESMTRIPVGGIKPSPNPRLMERLPDAYMTMGATAERVARRYGIARADQDAWALRSHQRALDARRRGVFAEEILPIALEPDGAVRAGERRAVAMAAGGAERGASGEREEPTGTGAAIVADDDALRPDSTLEKLASLKPVFEDDGTVTAGNACPTSDGAAALAIASTAAVERFGLVPLGRIVSYAVAGVAPSVMGVGPIEAVPPALARAGLSLADIDGIELNEAFASQVIAVVRGLGLPEDKTNAQGGAIALGHPLGATGARLIGTLLRRLKREKKRWGLATLCVGGGMGAAMVLDAAPER